MLVAAPFLWEGLVAVGTVVLAAATAYLAWSTRQVAKGTQADVQAQWRPVLLPSPDPPGLRSFFYERDTGRVTVKIRNAGRGPALFVRTRLDPGGFSPDNWSLGALAPGDDVKLTFTVPNLAPGGQLLVDYRDLSERTYSTVIVIQAEMSDWRFYDVRLFADGSATELGDAEYPPSGLRDARPHDTGEIKRVEAAVGGFWARFRCALAGFRAGWKSSQ
jgi:hypothetical protein